MANHNIEYIKLKFEKLTSDLNSIVLDYAAGNEIPDSSINCLQNNFDAINRKAVEMQKTTQKNRIVFITIKNIKDDSKSQEIAILTHKSDEEIINVMEIVEQRAIISNTPVRIICNALGELIDASSHFGTNVNGP